MREDAGAFDRVVADAGDGLELISAPDERRAATVNHRIPYILQASLFVFVASCATLVLELVAGRMLSPFIGVSLATWTSIIGVVLAGISVGSWVGGKIADRYASRRTVGLLFLLGGFSVLTALGIVALLGDGAVVRPIPLLARTFLLATIVFLPPSLILGMIPPVVIKLILPDVGSTGRIVGLVNALGALGSLGGNFITGFVLIAYFPITTITLSVSAVLLLIGLVSGEWWRKSRLVRNGEPKRPGFDGDGANRTSKAPTREAVAPTWLHMPGNVTLACFVVVISSFCVMAIELAASRILAPHIGVSLYSWTGIIGVILAGITAGNYLGGFIGDRWSRQPRYDRQDEMYRGQHVLGVSLFAGGLASLSIIFMVRFVTEQGLFNGLGLMERIVALTASVFFVPVLVLGTISPQVTKLAIDDLAYAGRIAGRVYAWSTVGAIVGTFATGWVLISLLGVYTLILFASLGLIALAFAVGRFWRHSAAVVASLAITSAVVYGLYARNAIQSPCTVETNYFCIKVYDEVRGGDTVKTLVLDHLIHSYVKIGDPSYLGYEHEQVQAEIARLVSARTSEPRILVIGGGGYTFPRWVEAFVPAATLEVAEIDPGVTETAYRFLGLSRDTRIISHNLDGRQFVHELAPRKSYQLVVQDAVNDLSVPYHILTKEYNDYVREILTDDGIYLLTVIDLNEDGQLMRAAVRTMMQTFPDVQLLGARPVWDYAGSSVFVIYGSNRRFDPDEMRLALASQGVDKMTTVVAPDGWLRSYVNFGQRIVLTDEYAPVDNLISILFRSRN